MLTSFAPSIRNVRQYPELQGARVLVSGVSAETGFDIARGFAEAGCRLIVQLDAGAGADDAARNTALLQVLAHTATEIRATEQTLVDADAAVMLARGAAQAYGGLDVVVNVIVPPVGRIAPSATNDDIEDAVSDTLRSACLITRIAANRMALTWTEGLIVNAVLTPPAQTAADAAFHRFLKLALGTMTRVEAGEWAAKGIRINAIGPRSEAASGRGGRSTTDTPNQFAEADLTALTLHLASNRGRSQSGHLFDANGVAMRRC